MNNRIFILGAGAIGMALAVHLIQNSRDVCLVRTSRDDVQEQIVTISLTNINNETVEVQARMVSLHNIESLEGLMVITAKTYANESISEKLAQKNVQSPIIIMQNGLAIEQPYLDAGLSEIYRCVLFSASQKLNEYSVLHTPIVSSPIGIIRGSEEKLEEIVATLSTPDFQFSSELNITEVIWQKAIINSVYNTVCPLLEIDNGIFQRNSYVTDIAAGIIEECVEVASKVGVRLDSEKIKQRMLAISKISDGQNISTLEDIRNQRNTEINSLNMEIVRIAEHQNPRIPVEKTKLLGELILLKSKISRGIL